MKLFRFIWQKLIAPAGVIYALLSFILLFLLTLTGNSKPAITLAASGIFLLLALMISVCNLIFSVKSLSLMTRAVLHFFSVLISIIIATAAGNYEMNIGSLVLILVYTAIYLIVVPPILIVISRFSQKQKEDKTYSSMFEDKK